MINQALTKQRKWSCIVDLITVSVLLAVYLQSHDHSCLFISKLARFQRLQAQKTCGLKTMHGMVARWPGDFLHYYYTVYWFNPTKWYNQINMLSAKFLNCDICQAIYWEDNQYNNICVVPLVLIGLQVFNLSTFKYLIRWYIFKSLIKLSQDGR